MNARLLKFKEKLTADRFNLKRKLITFSIFLLISTTFWILNALSDEYLAVISYPVEFSEFPEGKVLVGDLPENMQFRVKGKGFALLQYKFFPIIQPLEIDLNEIKLKKLSSENEFDYFILTRSLDQQIEKGIKSDISVLSIQPDTLFFKFASVITKKVPVKSNLKLSFEKQYMLSGPVVSVPDSVNITGPKSILDTIFFVYTSENSFRNLNDPIERNVAIEKIENVTLSEKRVNVIINVEKYTEAKLEIPIDVINMPDSIDLVILPEKIAINYKVVLSKYNKINASQFQAVVDYNDINFSISNKLKVKLSKFPKEIFAADYTPKNIEYIVKK